MPARGNISPQQIVDHAAVAGNVPIYDAFGCLIDSGSPPAADIVLPGDATEYYDGTGHFTVPSGGGGGGSNHFIQNLNAGVPSLASLTQVNISGTGSAVEHAGVALTIIDTSPPADSGLYMRGLAQSVPVSAPYRVAFFVLGDFLAVNFPGLGVGWRDSGTGKMQMLMSDNGAQFENQTYNSATSRASVSTVSSPRPFGAGLWMALRDDNAGNAIWEVSQTGAYWTPIQTVVKSGGFLAAYSQVVFALFCDDNTFSPKRPIAASCLCWDASAISGRVVGFVG